MVGGRHAACLLTLTSRIRIYTISNVLSPFILVSAKGNHYLSRGLYLLFTTDRETMDLHLMFLIGPPQVRSLLSLPYMAPLMLIDCPLGQTIFNQFFSQVDATETNGY